MLTEEQIQFLNRVCPDKWTEEHDIISVDGSVNIHETNLTQIPVQFGYVEGLFNCRNNKLTTLKGAPSIVNWSFNCDQNLLTTLEYGPKHVGGYYSCEYNKLTTLIGAPEICNDVFYCSHNQLTNLEGCHRIIKSNLHCCNNPLLKCLWGIGQVEGQIYYDNKNEINLWICSCMKRDIIFPYGTLEENVNWIKGEQKYSSLLDAPKEIRQYFSPRILQLVDSGVYNESRILDYKKFKLLC